MNWASRIYVLAIFYALLALSGGLLIVYGADFVFGRADNKLASALAIASGAMSLVLPVMSFFMVVYTLMKLRTCKTFQRLPSEVFAALVCLVCLHAFTGFLGYAALSLWKFE